MNSQLELVVDKLNLKQRNVLYKLNDGTLYISTNLNFNEIDTIAKECDLEVTLDKYMYVITPKLRHFRDIYSI